MEFANIRLFLCSRAACAAHIVPACCADWRGYLQYSHRFSRTAIAASWKAAPLYSLPSLPGLAASLCRCRLASRHRLVRGICLSCPVCLPGRFRVHFFLFLCSSAYCVGGGSLVVWCGLFPPAVLWTFLQFYAARPGGVRGHAGMDLCRRYVMPASLYELWNNVAAWRCGARASHSHLCGAHGYAALLNAIAGGGLSACADSCLR